MAYTGHIMTLANSIIGVGILAMPFCFQKCGIVLSLVLLVLSQYTTRISCHYLLKSSLLTRRKSFELLGLYAFGPSGKLMVELCIIGYLIGTCITYFVVVGDLAPQIVAKTFNLVETDSLRTWVMIVVTILCIIPLGLLKNVDSLSTVCIASIGFYFCLVVKIMFEAREHIFKADWTDHVTLWRPSGVLQCLPIFSMASACQMQLFEVIESINAASLEKLNEIVRMATTICTCVYSFVGFFGYVAFCTQPFSGNVLVNFSPSFLSDVIKLGFVLSVAFSFPLVIFPCRASIYSLLYRRGHTDSTGYIPENRFKCITLAIVFFALLIGIMIPSIELVIGLVGSTIGVAICVMFPALCFMKVFKKDSTEKLLAQFILISAFCLMILGTYANLSAIDEKRSGLPEVTKEPILDVHQNDNLELIERIKDDKQPEIVLPLKIEMNPEKEKFIDPMPRESVVVSSEPDVPVAEIVEKTGEKKIKEKVGKVEKLVKDDPVKQIDLNDKFKQDTKPLTNEKPAAKSNDEISKDAIKKEEEIIAGEESKNKKNEDIKETKEELKLTKQLLEKKVVELQEELAKQNLETQHLVKEQLGVIADKVDEIERKVDKGASDRNAEEKAAAVKSAKIDKERKKDVENAAENKPKPKSAETIIENIPLDDKKSSANGPILSALTEQEGKKSLQNDIPALPAANNKVYEPMSYKVGEVMNHDSQVIADNMKNKAPLPLPLLLNATLQKAVNRTGDLSKDTKPNENAADAKNAAKIAKAKKESADRENIESIRRDILQISNRKQEESTKLNNLREKRNAVNDEKSFCINWDLEKQYCRDGKVKEELLASDNAGADLKVQSFGRDLKSVVEEKENETTTRT